MCSIKLFMGGVSRGVILSFGGRQRTLAFKYIFTHKVNINLFGSYHRRQSACVEQTWNGFEYIELYLLSTDNI